MMSEQHPSVRGDVVHPVVQFMGGRGGVRIQSKDPAAQILAVEFVADQVEAEAEQGGEDRAHGNGLLWDQYQRSTRRVFHSCR